MGQGASGGAEGLPGWCHLIRADNPSPMTLEGTNTYVLSTSAGNVVIDPGPLIEDHLRAVASLGAVALTVLTHHHPDHTESAQRFHQHTGAPVTALDPDLCIDTEPVSDDEQIAIPDLDLRVLHTPGHTADSICLEVRRGSWRGLLCGDTILGRGTSVVAHPDGQLGAYLDSLARLRDRLSGDWMLLPAHGPVRADAVGVIEQYIAHRHARLDEVRAALASGATSAREVVEIVYSDVDRSVWPAAERTVAAALDYLTGAEKPTNAAGE
ncbi:MBL fold metallo-hydrolase [Actinobacteria bacterium YIM 96077]|uniref:MBL fold metallo-hydrolase n=1 Tax=Phytoactinopolyspora halophila TaxID=1981511 RepID=A0A329R0L8_9ACTN|nr:MBL fold metallo-hydrolase [Actinobacteria bacterium YIM 96077]RAW18141.1 MBL fold metallo-hydrolase [Phytoactinopolyspora halophila]